MSAQERITKLEALLERVRERGTRDDGASASAPLAAVAAVSPVAAIAASPAAMATPVPASAPVAREDAVPVSGIPEVTVGRDVVREVREGGRRISNVPASVKGTTDQELPSVIIAPPPSASAIASSPPSSMELDADDVIEAAPAPAPRVSRPPPPPPARAPSIPPPSALATPVPVPSAPPAPAPSTARAASPTLPPETAPVTTQPSLTVATPATALPVNRLPNIPQPRHSENRLGDADITAGHPVSTADVLLDDEGPTPSSSRRPRSEHAAAPEEDEVSAPPQTIPPESGRQASPSPAESGKRPSVPAVSFDRTPAPQTPAPQSARPDVASGRQPEAQVASFSGQATVAKPATFGELLDNALSL